MRRFRSPSLLAVRGPRRRMLVLAAVVAAVSMTLGVVEVAGVHLGRGAAVLGYESLWHTVLGIIPSWLILAALSPAVFAFAERYPLSERDWLRRLPFHGAAAAVFAVVYLFLTALTAELRPGGDFGASFGRVMAFYFPYALIIYAALVGAVQALRYHDAARARERAAADLRTRLAEARLQALRGQLHPHFIFNTLNSVTALAWRGEQRAVVDTLTALGELLRVVLSQELPHEVTLRRELELLRSYLEIQQLRFGDRLRVEWAIEPGTETCRVPTMVLQPLVENAISHAIARNRQGGTLVVRARRLGGRLHLQVDDTGPGSPADAAAERRGSGIGLLNTRARLEQLHGSSCSLELVPRPEGGSSAIVILPARGAEEASAVGTS